MKRLRRKGPFEVAVENVADPRIEDPKDVIVRITTANICGSDLHPYESRAPLDEGMVLGHENMGVVAETGPAIDRDT
ncbi:MAG TPA: alcohol dehydrogenase catalytic domain-containing protein [Streptosporangiaceae bacterium]